MTKIKARKETFYKIYSKNLSWVKEHPKISFVPDFEEGYVCPLCFNLFEIDALGYSSSNPLTFDHNPPQSLGGKRGVLTCKECNSVAGHKLDSQLLLRLEEMDFSNFSPNSKARTTLRNDNYKVASDFSVDGKGSLKINIDRKNSNPLHADNIFSNSIYNYKAYDPFLKGHGLFESGWNWRVKFDMQMPMRSDERCAEIALLKIAYLYAFEKFGYGFLINPNLYKIREQILNPDKNILPKVFWVNYDFPDDANGINIIKEPKELSIPSTYPIIL